MMIAKAPSVTADDVCVKCQVSRQDDGANATIEMTCIMRRWGREELASEHNPLSPSQWGMSTYRNNKVEIILSNNNNTYLLLDNPVPLLRSAPASIASNTATVSIRPPPSIGFRQKSSSSSNSDISTKTDYSQNGLLRRQRQQHQKQIDFISPPIPPYRRHGVSSLVAAKQNQHHSTSFPRIYSACGPRDFYHNKNNSITTTNDFLAEKDMTATSNSAIISTFFTIPSQDIVTVTILSPRRQIGLDTKNDGFFFLYFDNENSLDVVRLFLHSSVEPWKINHDEDENRNKGEVNRNPKKTSSTAAATSLLTRRKPLHKSSANNNRVGAASTGKGSFDIDTFQGRKMKDHVNNESPIRRAKRKMSYMANSVADWLSSLRVMECFDFVDCSGGDCGGTVAKKGPATTKSTLDDEFKTTRNLSGMVSMEEQEQVQLNSSSSQEDGVPQFSFEVFQQSIIEKKNSNSSSNNKDDDYNIPSPLLVISSASSSSSGSQSDNNDNTNKLKYYHPSSIKPYYQLECKTVDL